MKIEILGTGRYKFVELETLIGEVLRELGKTDNMDDFRKVRDNIEREITQLLKQIG